MQPWQPLDAPLDEFWQLIHHVVVPLSHCRDTMSLAHVTSMASHLGVNKARARKLIHFLA
jgi:hypothetical protein